MRRKAILLSLIGLLLVFLTLYLVDFDQFLEELKKISPGYLLLILTIQLTSNIVSSFKWRLVLRHSNVSMRNLLPATFVGYFMNGITPIGLAGGEPVKAYIISKTDNLPLTTAASSVLVDLFLEIVPMFLLSGIAIYLTYVKGVSMLFALFLATIAMILLLLFAVVITLVTRKDIFLKSMKRIATLLSGIHFLKKHITEVLPEFDQMSGKFNEAVRLHMLDNYILFFGTIMSLIVWGLRMLRTYLIFTALGVSIEFSTVLIVETTVAGISFLPLMPGALGVWESSSTALYILIAQPKMLEATAAAATIINRFCLFLLPLIIGLLCAVYMGLNIQKITNNEETNR
ncbi:MAG: flippase-like domain-containing protein [Candidatus Altiarchaeota archaeon]|nr:flippase-like domain-containing protein [Candidatus Altiarchaeota archaeon]